MSTQSLLPSQRIAQMISRIYRILPSSILIGYLSNCFKLETSKVTDFFVLSRLAFAVAGFILPYSWIIASILICDILLAHAAHLLDEHVGSAGPGARQSTNRSLLIALFNIGVLLLAFANLYRMSENISSQDAILISWSTTTAQGLLQPASKFGKIIALFHGTTNLLMLTVVLSTVLSGFEARRQTRPE